MKLTSEQVTFQKDKKGNYIMLQGPVPQNAITMLNGDAPHNQISKPRKQKWKELMAENTH